MRTESYTMLSVLMGIVLVGLPFISLITPIIAIAMALIMIWVIAMATGHAGTPGKIVLSLMAFTTAALVIQSYGTVFGLVPGTMMVLMLCALKLFELKSKRDISLVIFLCFFITASNFFHSQSFWIAIYIFFIVTYLVSLLVLINDRLGTTQMSTRLTLSFRYIALSTPLMLILFVTFPRLPHPLWTVPENAHSAKTGIPDEISPGSIGELIESDAVAFRVDFKGEVPEKKDLYWRGLVLSEFDGVTWRRGYVPFYAYPNVIANEEQGETFTYNITQEPTRQHWMFALETLVAYEGAYRIDREMMLSSEEPIHDVILYPLRSSKRAVNASMFPEERIKYLQLPAEGNERSMEFARGLIQSSGRNNLRYMTTVLDHFNREEFFYTLKPPVLGDDAIDAFMFESRKGFCEHYASAFAYLMRAGGIPARVVVGYQGGELHPQDGYMIVRQSDAHAWTEIWLNERWVRVDPTAVVSPQRIEQGVRFAGLEDDYLPSMILVENALLRSLMYRWDGFQYRWNQWVIGFDSVKQKLLFERLGFEDMSLADLAVAVVIAATGVVSLTFAWLIFVNRVRRDKVQRVYDRFCEKLSRHGVEKSRYEGAADFAARVGGELPSSSEEIRAITQLYLQLRYGDAGVDVRRRFEREVKRFRLAS